MYDIVKLPGLLSKTKEVVLNRNDYIYGQTNKCGGTGTHTTVQVPTNTVLVPNNYLYHDG